MKHCLFLLPLILLLGGCAFTMDEKTINYAFAPPGGEVTALNTEKSIQVGEITDDRNPSHPNLIFNKMNLNGDVTTGGYLAEKPIVEIIREGIVSGLDAALVDVREDADLELTGRLRELRYEAKTSWTKAELHLSMTIQIVLKDRKTQEVLYSENVMANDVLTEDIKVETAFVEIMDDWILELLRSEFFRSRIRAVS